MKIAKRVFLFVLTSFLITLTLSLLTSLLGIGSYLRASGIDYQSLAIFCLLWGFGGSFISLALSRWIAKTSYGVQLIGAQHPNQELRRLVEVVHHFARRAGLETMPEVGIYESPEANAFATGPTRNRALVAVSSGLLQTMNRDQVDGVLGHEISHIANGDMVTLTLIQGIVNAFVMFLARAIGFALSTQVKEESRRSVFFMTHFALEIALGLLASLVVFAFSRQREFRADAGGAKLAGRDKMLSGLYALLDISKAHRGERARGPEQLQAFKISGRSTRALSLFATHPPLEDRIARLQHSPNSR